MARLSPSAGFTLVETLAAMAVTAALIAMLASLLSAVGLAFDRATLGVSEADRLLMAVERLSTDFAAARFVQLAGRGGSRLAFEGQGAGGEDLPARISFVSDAGIASGPQGEEVIKLSIETSDGITRLVRRRAPWRGPRTDWDDLAFGDPVTLIEGPYAMRFSFARAEDDGALRWQDSWLSETALPRFVSIVVADQSGADRLAGSPFLVRADAPRSCLAGTLSCLKAKSDQPKDAKPAPAGGPT